jgi:putative Mn2+ efflux pump MntP
MLPFWFHGNLLYYGAFKNHIGLYPAIKILAIATSIDAFVVGISFSILNTPIIEPSIIIGIVAFILSFIAVYLEKD